MTCSSSHVYLKVLMGFLALALSACTPYATNNGAITLTLDANQVILIDAPAMSCVSAKSATPTNDLTSISFDAGRLHINWTPPANECTSVQNCNVNLKIVYVGVAMHSAGLTATNPALMTGQELACILTNAVDGATSFLPGASGGLIPGAPTTATPFNFAYDLVQGGLIPIDATKKKSFSGTANVLIYGVAHQAGQQDIPMVGRNTFQFTFGGIVF